MSSWLVDPSVLLAVAVGGIAVARVFSYQRQNVPVSPQSGAAFDLSDEEGIGGGVKKSHQAGTKKAGSKHHPKSEKKSKKKSASDEEEDDVDVSAGERSGGVKTFNMYSALLQGGDSENVAPVPAKQKKEKARKKQESPVVDTAIVP